jgi:hypothetical protein
MPGRRGPGLRFFDLCRRFSRIFAECAPQRAAVASEITVRQEFGRKLEFQIKMPWALAEAAIGA